MLTLVSMISSVLFQGYAYMMGSYQRLRDRQSLEMRDALVTGWWRSSMESLVPYYEGELRFSGSDTSLHGASFSPLVSDPGIAREIFWRLEQRDRGWSLIYEQPPFESMSVSHWARADRAQFQYLNQAGEWLSQWSSGGEKQLPEATRLLVVGASESQDFVRTATVITRKNQHIPSTVILYGRE